MKRSRGIAPRACGIPGAHIVRLGWQIALRSGGDQMVDHLMRRCEGLRLNNLVRDERLPSVSIESRLPDA